MTFDEFTAARLPALLRFAAVLAGDRALAEDLVQNVLIRAHDRWRRIAGLGPSRGVRTSASSGNQGGESALTALIPRTSGGRGE